MAPDSTFRKDTIPLGQMLPGQHGLIHSIDSADALLEERLREVGFDENLAIAVLHQAPLGRDPISVEVNQMTIALRRSEAKSVQVTLNEVDA